MASYLEKLNPQQRRAVEHGGDHLDQAGPLLIIAGAGSGKTNTLAHRVAHLIVNGVDPRRIMLLTFSRRAADEMTRRAERIVANVTRERAGAMTDALAWAGTFHAIGARLLREYAEQIGLDQAFTIHDRGNSADMINLLRHELGYSKTAKQSQQKEPVSQSTLEPLIARLRSLKCWVRAFRGARGGKPSCANYLPPTRKRSCHGGTCLITMGSCSTGHE